MENLFIVLGIKLCVSDLNSLLKFNPLNSLILEIVCAGSSPFRVEPCADALRELISKWVPFETFLYPFKVFVIDNDLF